MVSATGGNRTIFSVAEAFPLGRKFGQDAPAPVASGNVPFGVRMAVASRPIEVDLTEIAYDADRQIAVVRAGGVPVPLLQHTARTVKTNTSPSDAAPGDADETVEED